jgi:FKBP-type peptidyl-prolyl cis-trans isomerase FkpA
MRIRRGLAFLLLVFVVAPPSAGSAQLSTDSATAQIRQTAFAPWLRVNLDSSYQTWSGTFVRDLVSGRDSPVGRLRGVRVVLHMWLADGTPIIDPVRGLAAADTVAFRIGQGAVIRGLDEGVKGMGPGAVRQLVIPSVAGFGRAGRNVVPPNAVLVAEVRLIGAAYDDPVRVSR